MVGKLLSPMLLAGVLSAQFPGLTLPPSGNNQKAAVTQFIGPVRISIEYSSPAVHAPNGTDRRGKIWGGLVPYGLTNLGFGNGKPGPWRAGANENTVFETSHPVMVEGKKLPPGRYGLHMIAGPETWTIILSKNSTSWGSFIYEESEDALRVDVKPRKHEYREYLTYEFTNRKPTEATAELQWEEIAVPWNIKIENINDIYISNLRNELRTVPGFGWQGFVNAAQFAIQANTHLEQALQWADAAVSGQTGQKNFATLNTKAMVLLRMKRTEEGAKVLQEAIHHPAATPGQIHTAGRQLQAAGQMKEAVEVYKFNAQKHGEVWPTHVGLARAYMADGDLPKALEHARKALAQAPDPVNKNNLEAMVKSLAEGKAFNN